MKTSHCAIAIALSLSAACSSPSHYVWLDHNYEYSAKFQGQSYKLGSLPEPTTAGYGILKGWNALENTKMRNDFSTFFNQRLKDINRPGQEADITINIIEMRQFAESFKIEFELINKNGDRVLMGRTFPWFPSVQHPQYHPANLEKAWKNGVNWIADFLTNKLDQKNIGIIKNNEN